ncbi:MAG: response regulator [Campylobacterales bacterium]|nr:response regulator [Campylobacterales bacterium]
MPIAIHIIDDNAMFIETIETMFEIDLPDLKNIYKHTNPCAFLELVLEGKISQTDFLIIDQSMPQMLGTNLIKSILNKQQNKIVLFTGNEHQIMQDDLKYLISHNIPIINKLELPRLIEYTATYEQELRVCS